MIRRLVGSFPRPRSIRAQLVGLVAVIAVPLVVLQVYAGYQNYRRTVFEAELRVQRLAEGVGAGVRQFASIAERQIVGIAEIMGRSGLEPEACSRVAPDLRDAIGFVRGVSVVDAAGEFVCSTLALPSPEIPDVADRVWFHAVGDSRSFLFGPPQRGVDDDWISVLTAPVLGRDGQVVGAVASGIDLVRFEEILAGVTIPSSALVTISNGDGAILARNVDPHLYVGGQITGETLPERTVGPNLTLTEGPDLAGIERTWSRLVLPDVGWRIYAGLPNDEIFGPARARLARSVLTSLLFLGMALTLALLFYRRISSSLRQLTVGTRAAAGGRAVHLPSDALSEVRQVGEQLNRTLEARGRAEEAERLSKEHFLSIFENATFGICLGTRDGRFLEVNPALVDMLGYDSAEELLAVNVTSFYASTEDRERLIEEHVRGNTFENIETEWRRKDGSAVTVRMNGRVLFSDLGLVFVTIVEDITGEKVLEEQLRQTQKMEAVGRLAGGVAHDFNNLLTVIMGHARLLLDRPGSSDDQADAEQILAASERAAALTQQLLSFSRKQVTQPRPMDLNEVVGNLQKMLGRLIGEDVELVTELDPALPAVMADPGEIEQVVMNLAVNARDAMPDGGRLSLTTSFRVVEDRSEADAVGASTGQYVVLAVSDTGVGMPPEVAKLAFEPFFTTKPVGKGTGLGLATVYGIVRQAGGAVSVDTGPGKGCTVEILLPKAASLPETTSAELKAPPSDGGGRTVLVVEDEDDVRSILARVLGRAGYEVLDAETPAVALRIAGARDKPIDLLITDMVMPGMKGTEMAAEFAVTRPETPVLYISGYTDGGLAQEQIRENPSIFLAKPFSPLDLLERVAELIGLPQSGDQGERGAGSSARATTDDAAVSDATTRMAAR